MSDLNPKGIPVELGGQERNLLFTINAIDEVQEALNMPLFDAIQYAADAADNKLDHETITGFRTLVTVLLNCGQKEKVTEEEVGQMLTLPKYHEMAWKVLEAFGVSIPEPQDDEEDETEEEAPNAQTGR